MAGLIVGSGIVSAAIGFLFWLATLVGVWIFNSVVWLFTNPFVISFGVIILIGLIIEKIKRVL
jgi:hypothetical protein